MIFVSGVRIPENHVNDAMEFQSGGPITDRALEHDIVDLVACGCMGVQVAGGIGGRSVHLIIYPGGDVLKPVHTSMIVSRAEGFLQRCSKVH